MKNKLQSPRESQIIFYTSPKGNIKIDVFFQDENIWLTQKKMAELFNVDRTVITKYLQNIFQDKELDQNSVCAKIALTAEDGKDYPTNFYNLDCIITVGYRVNSYEATQFRKGNLEAKLKAEMEYEEYRVIQDKEYISDFDREVKRIEGKE